MAAVNNSVSNDRWTRKKASRAEPLRGAFFWLSAFYVVYCTRPEDWIPVLKIIPLAKISGIFALVGLVLSTGKSKRRLRDLPRETIYLACMIGLLFVAALLSPVWRGGSFFKTLDFSKVLIVWVLTFIVVTSFARLKRIIFIQSASVVLITVVSVIKGHSAPRLEGVIGGVYSNPNDLAFAIVLTLPFCLAFLLSTRSAVRKLIWVFAMLAMCLALFLTASRGGFITLLVTGAFGLWHFGVKGKRFHVIIATALVAMIIGVGAGGRLKDRFLAISDADVDQGSEQTAHGSYEQRRYLIFKSLEGIRTYPRGIGLGNFPNYSGVWREVHVAYLQIAVEGGIAALIFYLLFFNSGLRNLRLLIRTPANDTQTELFARALHSSLTGFLVGALFAPEAYQYFPYFAVSYTSVLLVLAKEKRQQDGTADPRGPRQLLKRGNVRAGELAPVR